MMTKRLKIVFYNIKKELQILKQNGSRSRGEDTGTTKLRFNSKYQVNLNLLSITKMIKKIIQI